MVAAENRSNPSHAEEHTVLIHGLRTYYRAVGEGPSVVLAHGAGVSTAYWRPAQDRLAEAGPFRVYSLDFPGFGRSEAPPWRVDVPRLTAHLLAWADRVVPAPFDLVGQSLGCEVALLATVDAPERVRRLVLAGPASLPYLRSVWEQILLAAVDAPRERLGLYRAILPAYLRCGPVRLLQALRAQRGYPDEAALRRVEQRTLVLRGERDPLVSPERLGAIAGALPRAETGSVPGAHGGHFTHPEAFARRVGEFLNEP